MLQGNAAKESPHLWFRAKRYGYGWYPSSWQGALVVILYISALTKFLLDFLHSDTSFQSAMDLIFGVIVITFVLIYVCIKKGEKARWRWGD